jgi:hypothetical protein
VRDAKALEAFSIRPMGVRQAIERALLGTNGHDLPTGPNPS